MIINLRALSALFIGVLASLPLAANAADLQFTPSSGSFVAGKAFMVDVYVSGNTEPINAVSGTLSFPTDLVSVSSVSKGGSIVTLWPEEPGFSNTIGTVHFEGAILNPGFSGSRGKVISITFMPKRTGKAAVLFTSGSVLANDGSGTSVLNQLGTGSYTLTESAAPVVAPKPSEPATKTAPVAGVPDAPVITSSTNPDTTVWYSDPSPSFSWSVAENTTSLRISYDESPTSIPTHVYGDTLTEKTLDAVADGVHYLHLQFKNSHGWGSIADFRFQVDTTPPTVTSHAFTYDQTRRALVVAVSALDSVSGISGYELTVDGGTPEELGPEAFVHGSYPIQIKQAGSHSVLLRITDKAGNHLDIPGTFEAAQSILDMPVFQVGEVTVRLIVVLLALGLLSLLSLVGLGLAVLAWYRMYCEYAEPREERKLNRQKVHHAFLMLRSELEKHVRALKKAKSGKALTDAEAALGHEMAVNINDFERFLVEETDMFD